MRVTHEVRYDASVDDVYAMLTDRVFRERAARAQGSTTVDAPFEGWETEHEVGVARLEGDR
jgi:hypothetical protein